eukprot:gene19093-biopygen18264
MDIAGIPKVDEDVRAAAAEELCSPIEWEEFNKHLRKRAGMAAGLDHCTWEVLQTLPEDVRKRIWRIMRLFLSDGLNPDGDGWCNFPQSSRDSWQSPIPKSGFNGTIDKCSGISMTPAIDRLLGKIVTARLTRYVERMGCLSPTQAGFRRGRSTLATVARLQSFLVRSQKAHMLSVDVRRAFDLAEPR